MKKMKKRWRVNYKATVRGVLEVEAINEEETRQIADSNGADHTTCEQTDFEITSVRQESQ